MSSTPAPDQRVIQSGVGAAAGATRPKQARMVQTIGAAAAILGFAIGLPLLVAAGIVVLVGSYVALPMWHRYQHRSWEMAELTVPNRNARMGETFLAEFRQIPRDKTALAGATVEAALVCVERVRYTSGSTKQTLTNERNREPVAVRLEPDDVGLHAWLLVVVPSHIGPTFNLANNALTWSIEVKIITANGGDPCSTFGFVVGPEHNQVTSTSPWAPGHVHQGAAQLHDDDNDPTVPVNEALEVHVDADSLSCGDVVRGSFAWQAGAAPRGARVVLRYKTEGRGDTDTSDVDAIEFAPTPTGSHDFALTIPRDGPLSYFGDFITIRWVVRGYLDVGMRRDPSAVRPLTVGPRAPQDQ